MVVQSCKSFAKVLICFLSKIHSIKSTHQYTVEFNCFRVQWRRDIFQTLHRLLLCYLIFSIIQSDFTYVSYGSHIVIFAANPLFQESFHKSLHLATLESIFDSPFIPILTVLVSQHLIRKISQPVRLCLPHDLNPAIAAFRCPKRSLTLSELLKKVIILLLLLL